MGVELDIPSMSRFASNCRFSSLEYFRFMSGNSIGSVYAWVRPWFVSKDTLSTNGNLRGHSILGCFIYPKFNI